MDEKTGHTEPYTPIYTPGEGSDMAIFLSELHNFRIINDIVYFRIKVPSQARQWFGKTNEILRSLHCKLKITDPDPSKVKVPNTVASRLDLLRTKANNTFFVLINSSLSDQAKIELVKELMPPKEQPEPKYQPGHKGKLLSDVITEFIKHEQSNEVVVKSMYEIKFSCRLVQEIIGDKPIQDVTREDAKRFRETLEALPPKFTDAKQFRDMTIEQVLAAGPHEKKMARNTVCNKIGWMSSLFLYAIQEGYYLGQNPAFKLKPKRKQKANKDKRQYTKAELQKIFSGLEWNQNRPERFWVPVIGLFHGVRLNQICQLHLTDIVQDDVIEVWCFDFNDDSDDQSMKADASRRRVFSTRRNTISGSTER